MGGPGWAFSVTCASGPVRVSRETGTPMVDNPGTTPARTRPPPPPATSLTMSPAAHSLPTLVQGELTLRPSIETDVPPLLALLADPGVAEWWGDNTVETLTDELVGAFTILVDGAVAGILECHEETEPMFPEVSFDIMLGAGFQGRGRGRRALRLAIDYFVSRGYHRFAIDPAAGNTRAIRCYTAVGFKPVGILRSCERAPSGGWRDGLLMDLLADELPET